jgi:two-component system response regulator MprA
MAERVVLVVDDDEDIRSALCMVLALRGVATLEAADGVEALALLGGEARVSLILVDLMMPRMNGWDFRRAQLSDPRLAQIPVVLISCDPKVREAAVELGACAGLEKPVDLDQLFQVVTRYARDPGT